jgi:hypothetical protein
MLPTQPAPATAALEANELSRMRAKEGNARQNLEVAAAALGTPGHPDLSAAF